MENLKKHVTKINVEMSGDTKRYLVSAKQGDKSTRHVIATLLNDGALYEIPEEARVIANIEKPDGKHVYNDCDFSGAVVTLVLTNQILSVAGTAFCDMLIYPLFKSCYFITRFYCIRISLCFFNLDRKRCGCYHLFIVRRSDLNIAKCCSRNRKNTNEATDASKKATTACKEVTERAEDALQNQEQLEATLNTATQIRQEVSQMQTAVAEAKKQVEQDKKDIDDTIQNSLLASAEKILESVQDYFKRAEALYSSMYLDCDGETPYMRTVTPIFIDGATPQVRNANEGVDFDGGTPTSRQLAV